MKHYNKLVRDLIPDVIEKNHQKCTYKLLSDDDFLLFAEKKLLEELNEYYESHALEELIDLIEVIQAIAEVRGFSWEGMEMMRIEKRTKRGGFSKKIFLESVE